MKALDLTKFPLNIRKPVTTYHDGRTLRVRNRANGKHGLTTKRSTNAR